MPSASEVLGIAIPPPPKRSAAEALGIDVPTAADVVTPKPGILDRAGTYLRETFHDPNAGILKKTAAGVAAVPLAVANIVTGIPGAIWQGIKPAGEALRGELTPQGMEEGARNTALMIAPGALRTTGPMLDAAVTKMVPPPIGKMPLAGPETRLLAQSAAADTANEAMYNAMIQAGWTPERIAAKLKQLGPSGTLADLQPFSGMQTVSAQTIPGNIRAQQVLGAREAQKQIKMLKSVGQNISPENYYSNIDALRKAKSVEAAPLYKEAFSNDTPVISDDVDRLIADPAVQDGINHGLRLIQQENSYLPLNKQIEFSRNGVKFNEAGDPIYSGVPTLQVLDAGIRGLDKKLDTFRSNITGKIPKTADTRVLMGQRERLNELLIANSGGEKGAYARAKATWAGPSRMEDVMSMGRGILNNDPEVSVKLVKELTPQEKEYLQIGLARDVADDIKQNTTRALTAFRNPDARAIMQAAFPNKMAYNKFRQDALRAQVKTKTYNKATAGTDTAMKRAGAIEISEPSTTKTDIANAAFDLATQNHLGFLRRMGNKMLSSSGGVDTRTPALNEVSSVLHSTDPIEQQMLLNNLRKRAGATGTSGLTSDLPPYATGGPVHPGISALKSARAKRTAAR